MRSGAGQAKVAGTVAEMEVATDVGHAAVAACWAAMVAMAAVMAVRAAQTETAAAREGAARSSRTLHSF